VAPYHNDLRPQPFLAHCREGQKQAEKYTEKSPKSVHFYPLKRLKNPWKTYYTRKSQWFREVESNFIFDFTSAFKRSIVWSWAARKPAQEEGSKMAAKSFADTLGAGPYKFAGFAQIHKGNGTTPPKYPERPARFVRGMGTCAHCGMAILNVYMVEIGNGDVFGVGSDCIGRIHASNDTMGIHRLQRDVNRAMASQRKAVKIEKLKAKRAELCQLLIDAEASLKAQPHPTFPAKTLYDYAEWMAQHAGDKGVSALLKELRK
jgi:hypothetical protein